MSIQCTVTGAKQVAKHAEQQCGCGFEVCMRFEEALIPPYPDEKAQQVYLRISAWPYQRNNVPVHQRISLQHFPDTQCHNCL